MATNRKLIDYLPHFMQRFVEIVAIMDTEQVEVDRLWTNIENAFSDQFILEATVNGVKRWESMLGISPKDTDTLDERKFRILATMNQELPYTMRKLEQMLTNLCGVDGFSIELDAANYNVVVTLALENENNLHEVERMLTKILPANMTKKIQIMYTSNANLSKYTHEQLSVYTHEQIREVFANV